MFVATEVLPSIATSIVETEHSTVEFEKEEGEEGGKPFGDRTTIHSPAKSLKGELPQQFSPDCSSELFWLGSAHTNPRFKKEGMVRIGTEFSTDEARKLLGNCITLQGERGASATATALATNLVVRKGCWSN